MSLLNTTLSVLVLLLFTNCDKRSTPEENQIITPSERIIKFSGYDWIVRKTKSAKEGPGPNLFSDSEDNVWVDNQGKLHLKITQKGGQWYCSGITLRNSLSYGKYTFFINSDVSKLDDNVVAGLFTYLTDTEEIDIEFSKWSVSDNMNTQFAVQPSGKNGNKVRFDIPSDLGPTTHSFNWQKNKISFESLSQNSAVSNVLHKWDYMGGDIPSDKEERLKINLWLFRGQMPKTLQEQEIVIDSLKFEG